MQQVPHQQVPHQQVPHQQVPHQQVHQQVPVQPVQQQHIPSQHVPIQQGHGHDHPQQILNAANIAHEKAYVRLVEDMSAIRASLDFVYLLGYPLQPHR